MEKGKLTRITKYIQNIA